MWADSTGQIIGIRLSASVPIVADVSESIGSITRLLLVTMSIAMAHDSAPAQSSSAQRETPLPSSITAVEGSGDSQPTSIQQGSVDQKVTNPCSLHAPDNISQSPAMGKQASM